jgi:hypothetical protein
MQIKPQKAAPQFMSEVNIGEAKKAGFSVINAEEPLQSKKKVDKDSSIVSDQNASHSSVLLPEILMRPNERSSKYFE